MVRNRFFCVTLVLFLTVTAFLVGYEVKPAPGTENPAAGIETGRQPDSVAQALERAIAPPFQGALRGVEAAAQRRPSAADPLFSFGDVFQLITEKYVDEITEEGKEELTYGAIRGMLRALDDPYTRFMDPKDYSEFQNESRGELDGIGALLGIERETNLITIVATFEGNPAHEAGLRPGDYIVGINGESTEDMSLDVAVSKIRGKAGTPVTLTILRPEKIEPLEQDLKVTPQGEVIIPAAALQKAHLKPNDTLKLHVENSQLVLLPKQRADLQKPTMEVKVTRATVRIPVIQKQMLPGKIGYVWLQLFNEKSEQQLDQAIADLQQQKMRGFILDLRNDPGGLLEMAVIVASKFIQEGPIVFIKERGKEKLEELRALPQEYKDLKVPLVVLVNKFSASASEIVAGAIQDYKVGKIVGTPTFGKGSVQTVVPLHDRSAVAITTAKYLTPKQRDINKKGIEPDIKVETPEGFLRPSPDRPDEDPQLQAAIREIEVQLAGRSSGRGAQKGAES
jgi:carboxyl-terminal processing protease